MAKIRTHYDNLKVARDAPIEVIRAAYKSLCIKYHPDLNGNVERNVRIMAILNTSYEVLADSERRRQHDEWIIEQECESEPRSSDDGAESKDRQEPRYERADPMAPQAEASQGASATAVNPPRSRAGGTDIAHILQVLSVPLAVLALFWVFDSRPSSAPASRRESVSQEVATAPSIRAEPLASPTTSSKVGSLNGQKVREEGVIIDLTTGSKSALPAAPLSRLPAGVRRVVCQRGALDPNGKLWPASSNYLAETTIGNSSGRAHITIDNSRNDSDVFLKLVWHEPGGDIAVRLSFIKAGDQFKMQNIGAGTYDVRYQDLDSCALNSSRTFALEEVEEADAVRFSAVTLTLYKVRGGNAPMHAISEKEFLIPEIQ